MKQIQQIQPPIPSRELVTQQQVGTILSSIATLLPFFHISHDNEESGALDGGVKCAVQVSMIKMCERLDKIMDDESRWNVTPIKRLEDHLVELYRENIKVLKLQQQQIYHLARPHVRHSPGLYRLEDGSWAAVLGDINDIPNAVVGVGGSPAQALEAFDDIFNGNIPIHLQAWIAARDEALEKNLKPPTTKAEYEQGKQSMDGSGNHGPETNEGGGSQPREDRGGAGPDKDSGGPQGGPSAAI